MGSANIKATVSSAVPPGTPSPLVLSAPSAVRSSNLLGGMGRNLASDLDNIAQVVNALHKNQQLAPSVSQILLTNAQGEVTAAFGPIIYKGVPYVNFLSEIHVGNPLQKQDPTQALFNANPDGSVSIGQNGWIDVHDPFGGNAAWIGTQYETVVITGAADNGSGAIRLTVPGHTLVTGDKTTVRNMNLFNVPNAVGSWKVTMISGTLIDLDGSVWSGPFIPLADPPSGIKTYQPTIERWLQIANVTNNGALIRITTTVAHGYESGSEVNIPAPGPGGIPNAVGQWIINVPAGATTFFDLVGSTFAGAYTAGGEVIQYFAGMLAQTIAIGPSFQNYNLRAFPSGDLRIRNASIELSSVNGGVVIDPSVPDIVLTSATDGKITLDGATAQIILNAPLPNLASIVLDAAVAQITLNAPLPSLAKIVLDATIPHIVLFNAAGVQTISLDSNGVITGATFPGGISGTATLAKITGPGANGSLSFVGGLITAYTAPT